MNFSYGAHGPFTRTRVERRRRPIMIARRFSTVTAVALALGALHATPAGAYQYLKCDGNPVKWHKPFGTVQNLHTIPVGSEQSGAYVNAIKRWNAIPGMRNMVYHWGTTSVDHFVDIDD